MNISKWVGGYKVQAFQWIDEKSIYFNVQYFAPGQSLQQPPKLDKSVLIADNEQSRRMVCDFTSSLAEYVAGMRVTGTNVLLTFKSAPAI